MDKAPGDIQRIKRKRRKLKGPSQIEEQNSSTVLTIGTMSIVHREIISVPPEVLRVILLMLEKRDLVLCRRINSLWRDLTSKILRGHDDNDIKLDGRKNSLSSFMDCLTRSKELGCLDQFPCTRFIFFGIYLDAEDTQNFFDLYGPCIKKLKLRMCQSIAKRDGQLATLAQLLIHQAPNIEDLDIDYVYILLPTTGDEQIPLFHLFPPNNKIKLSALKKLATSLTSTKRNEILEELLDTAENLTWYNVHSKYDVNILNKLVSLKKFNTIKSAKVNLWRHLEFFDHFANLRPNLQSVAFYIDPSLLEKQGDFNLLRRTVDIIQKILESSRHTLEQIDHMTPLSVLPELEMPILSHLKEFGVNNHKMNFDSWIMSSVFPLGLSLATVFPNVRKVDMKLGKSYFSHANFWTTFFPHIDLVDNTWPSVTCLKISDIPPASMDNISKLFPNLKILTVVSVKNFSLFCHGIFGSMKQLECLEFDGVDCGQPENKYPSLESAITGFSLQTCRRLAKSHKSLDDVDVQNLRENLSILDLKNLTSLKLTGIRNFGGAVLTRVSGIFAFRLLPQLNVTVELTNCLNPHNNAALKAMAPFFSAN